MTSESALVERWRSLLNSYSAVASHLERALHEAHGLTMGEFETLDRLFNDNCGRRRMQVLAAEMYLSQSALSRTVARLERGGLVQRALCEDDRRGVFVEITPSGIERHAEAVRTRAAVLTEHLEQPAPASAND